MVTDALYQAVQEACLPGTWSKGVALSREKAVRMDVAKPDEIRLRVRMTNRPVSPQVTLWPKDEDWHCDCGDRNDPCHHVAAAVIALKMGLVSEENLQNPSEKKSEELTSTSPTLQYRFYRVDGALEFDRHIRQGGKDVLLRQSLVALIGGIQSGRVTGPRIAATKADFGVDQVLGTSPDRLLNRATLHQLLARLEDCTGIELDGKPVATSRRALPWRAILMDDGSGFRLKIGLEMKPDEWFRNGAALIGERLVPIAETGLGSEEVASLSGDGRHFAREEASLLVTRLLPGLRSKMEVIVETSRLPELVSVPPRIVLQTQALEGDVLAVFPQLVYGDPPIARVTDSGLESLTPGKVTSRDLAEEKLLTLRLQNELNLRVGKMARFEGEAAARFSRSAQGWDTRGDVGASFRVEGTLRASLELSRQGLTLSFMTPSGNADADRVLRAWREGAQYVPLLAGGWAALPIDWLQIHGTRIQALLAARDVRGALPAHRLPEAIRVAEESGSQLSEGMRRLRDRLVNFDRIPPASLPEDLHAELRTYQRQGVNWLSFLRDSEMGAVLADDMGLGKTLQAICVMRGHTLVVCPTSVISSWRDQIERFRPDLRVCVYYGAQRTLDPDAHVVLTSYALMRQETDQLGVINWDTLILDESQTIRNPGSLVAQAAYGLRARFKLALSGTPVENRLEDLWSQFQFVNPGLLGTRSEFADEFAAPIGRGDSSAAGRLRDRIRPFLLRRTKSEVAPELPPRTEITLNCELGDEERAIYQAILGATRAEVLRQVEEGGNVMGALEALLRLRQACSHASLVPGQALQGHSSKLKLLVDTLQESIANDHRALVFSQWTSLLDLIEEPLREAGIGFLRLDGSTRDRADVVERFQDPSGPPILLMSLKAGGVGITLTAADHVFLMDPWWNPAAEDQAADRAHRIGQENPVLIHRLVAKDTVEERILELQSHKRKAAQAAIQDGAAAATLTREDLLNLLR